VLDRFDWTIPHGARVCVGGPSGIGKTTLLRLLAGLITPDEGLIERLPSHVSYHFQENRLLSWYNVRKNLALFTSEPDAWLDRVGLSDDSKLFPEELSGGMKRRLSLARALAVPAPALLLDEPFMELDSQNKERLIGLLKSQAADTGRSYIIMVTHDERDAGMLGWDYQTPLPYNHYGARSNTSSTLPGDTLANVPGT
jgi:NitT/TauT family transport system ATP-binding protein